MIILSAVYVLPIIMIIVMIVIIVYIFSRV